MPKKFKILMDDNPKALETEITSHLQKGWGLHGALQISTRIIRRVDNEVKPSQFFVQALTKD